MNVKELVNKADREIDAILTELESNLKEQDLKVGDVSIDRAEVNVLGQRETDQLFTTYVNVEVRR